MYLPICMGGTRPSPSVAAGAAHAAGRHLHDIVSTHTHVNSRHVAGTLPVPAALRVAAAEPTGGMAGAPHHTNCLALTTAAVNQAQPPFF